MLRKSIVGLALAGFALGAVASDIKAPFALPSAKVLPTGVRNLSNKTLFIEANDKYNNTGTATLVAEPFFVNITFGDIIAGKKNPVDKAGVQQTMMSIGKSTNDSFGNTTGQVNVKATAQVPVLAWGLTRKLTVAVAVPVVQYSTNVNSGMVQANAKTYQDMLLALGNKGVVDKQREFLQKMANPTGSKLQEYGYEPLQNEEGTKLGDIKLVSKYLLTERPKYLITFQGDVTLPTGEQANINKVVDVAGGDGQPDLGMSIIGDYKVGKYFTVSAQSGYIWQIPDRTAKRIPEKVTSTLSPDIDNSVFRDLGDHVYGSLATSMNYNGLNLGLGYTLQYKERDEYHGTNFSVERYNWLEINTEQEMHSVQMLVGYDTITLFKQKKFPAPLRATLTHTRVVHGKNVVSDPLTALDFSLFF